MAMHCVKKDSMIMGVCQGLAEEYKWDVSIVRLVFALGAFFTGGTVAIVYLIMGLVLPTEETKNDSKDKKDNSDDDDFTF